MTQARLPTHRTFTFRESIAHYPCLVRAPVIVRRACGHSCRSVPRAGSLRGVSDPSCRGDTGRSTGACPGDQRTPVLRRGGDARINRPVNDGRPPRVCFTGPVSRLAPRGPAFRLSHRSEITEKIRQRRPVVGTGADGGINTAVIAGRAINNIRRHARPHVTSSPSSPLPSPADGADRRTAAAAAAQEVCGKSGAARRLTSGGTPTNPPGGGSRR